MLMTARMIADRLGKCLVEARIPDSETTGYTSIRVLMPDEIRIESGQAYVVDSKRLCTLSFSDSTSLLICQSDADTSHPCSMIFCDGSVSEIYQAALAVVAEYSSLEDELNEGILGDWDLNHLLVPLVRFFKNPILVFASIFNVVTGVKPIFSSNGVICGTETYIPPISAESVYGMTRSNDLREDLKIKEASYFRYPGFDCGCYQVNLIENDSFVGRLVVIDEFLNFNLGVSDTLNAVAKYIRHHMVHHNSALSAKLLTVEYSILEILEGKTTNKRLISSQLSAISWPLRDDFGIFCFCFPTPELPTKDLLTYHIQAISQLMRNAIVLSIENRIVAVIRLRDFQLEEIEDLLTPYMSKSDMYAGLGETFYDIRSARSCYLQAKAAVNQGINSKMTRRIFRYQDYAVEHLVSIAIESEYGAAFVHPTITLIEEYDRANQTELLLTLRTYLENQCNQVESANILHIHRNSLKYRLHRLNEIMGIDLRSSDQQLRLILSILIRDKLNSDVDN